MDKKKGEPNLYERFHTQGGGGGCTAKIDPILPETVRTGCYIIANKVMRSYYKGECMLDALSVADFCANGVVFNWCSYLLEELLVACEEAQEKGGTFTYGYLLMAFTMLKWKPPIGRPLVLADKGHLAKMFEPWHSRDGLGEHNLQQHDVLQVVQWAYRCNAEVVHSTGAPQLQHEEHHFQHEPTSYVCMAEAC
jgi:hypothetical protein